MNASTDPIVMAADATLLLSTGRTGMALAVLDRLPAALEAALTQAHGVGYLQGQADAHRIIAAARERQQAQRPATPAATPAPRKLHRLDLLRDALADPIRRERAKAVLGMGDRLLERVAAGGATLSLQQWRRLREALA